MAELRSVQIHIPSKLDEQDNQGAVSYGGGIRSPPPESLNNGSLLG